MTPGKIIALTRWTFVGKVMSLLFKMLSRLISDSKKKKNVETLTKQVNSVCKGQETPQRITLDESSQRSQGALMVGKGGSNRWTGLGGARAGP